MFASRICYGGYLTRRYRLGCIGERWHRSRCREESSDPSEFAYRRTQVRRQLYRECRIESGPAHSHVLTRSENYSQIYTPQGATVWYGRVTPHEVEAIVEHTIIGGLVLPSLLRGGANISRPGCSTLNDW